MIYEPNPSKRIAQPATRYPTEGIYYVIRTPEGWRLIIYRYGTAAESRPEIHHVEFWQTEVAPCLAQLWAGVMAPPATRSLFAVRLKHQLHGLYYAFPRGRIDRGNGTVYCVRNGNNMNRKMPTRKLVEKAFEIKGVCEWEFDSHEQCMDEDASAIRELLKLKETWISVEPQE